MINPDALLQIGEFANDYIEVRRDYTDWTAIGDAMSERASEVPTTDTYANMVLGQTQHGGKEDPPLESIPEKTGDDAIAEVVVIA